MQREGGEKEVEDGEKMREDERRRSLVCTTINIGVISINIIITTSLPIPFTSIASFTPINVLIIWKLGYKAIYCMAFYSNTYGTSEKINYLFFIQKLRKKKEVSFASMKSCLRSLLPKFGGI